MLPRAPGSVRAQAEPSAKPGMLDGPCLGEAPRAGQPLAVRRGQFGSERCKMVFGLLGESWGRDQGVQGQGHRTGLHPCSWEKPKHSAQEKPWDLLPSQGSLQPGTWDTLVPLLSLTQPPELCVSKALPKNTPMS